VPVIIADSAWHRLRKARQAGVPVYFGELLSEHAEHELELGAFGSLLACGQQRRLQRPGLRPLRAGTRAAEHLSTGRR
jgi:hypothetical protein